jgi:hypothetical protein
MRLLEKIVAYFSLAAVLTLSILWGALDAWFPKQADLSRVLGFILGLMAIVTAYTWIRHQAVQRSLDALRDQITVLTAQTCRLSDSLDAQLGPLGFKQAFELVANRHPNLGRVRIRAITSQIIQQEVFNHDFTINRCDVMVYQTGKDSPGRLEANIQSVLNDWRDRYARKNIGSLNIRRDPNIPREYEVIFDNQVVLWGMYITDPGDPTGVRSSKATFISAASAENQEVISNFIERFDLLFHEARPEYPNDNLADDPDAG